LFFNLEYTSFTPPNITFDLMYIPTQTIIIQRFYFINSIHVPFLIFLLKPFFNLEFTSFPPPNITFWLYVYPIYAWTIIRIEKENMMNYFMKLIQKMNRTLNL
jgi:hypothetical protein